MALASGEKLGPYEILSPLGKGGMGEVYRARDTRLNRDVAVKVSAERFSERFEREERVIASLNHPNICHLYDVGPNYLVMELIEGPTLGERIKQGPLPLDEALNIARQIADALEAAHEKGITHRDLKPGNIKIKPDGTVKVLDFGLAKMGGTPTAQSGDSPTLTMGQTEAGMILGTAAYMSPEQAKGKPVDQRSDIYAFGLVLYEMVTGKRVHDGESTTEVLASVIKEEPQWDKVPRQIERLVKRCLAKDPQKRLRHIGDVMLLVDEAQAAPTADRSQAEGVRHGWLWPGLLVLSILALTPVNVIHLRERPPVVEPMRFQIPPPTKNDFGIYLAVSPDGKRLAFTAAGSDGMARIWIRDLDTLEARALNGTEGAQSLFWSPDSRSIAFGFAQQLKKIDVSGGPPQTLCESQTTVGSGAWSKSGVIIFGGRGAGPLQQVSEAGGTPSPITALVQGTFHSFPSFLPDGRHFIYFRFGGDTEGIYLGSLDSKPTEQNSRRLVATSFGGVYAPDPNGGVGRILFLRDGTLMAQPFNAERLELAGEAVPIAEQVGSTNQYANVSASANGVLAYRTGSGGNVQLTWLDRDGRALGQVGEPGQYATLTVSPDGTRAAFRRGADLWLMEFERGVSSRFTFAQGLNDNPVWSPDGRQIVFNSNRSGRFDLYWKASNGAGDDELLLKTEQDKVPDSWSRDGRFLVYQSTDPKTGNDVWALPLQGDRTPVPLLRTQFGEGFGAVSPDGRWLAYLSTESGSGELYVRPFAPSGSTSAGKWQVSNAGAFATQPFWRGDGKELFYRAPSLALMGVDVTGGATFQGGLPHRLFEAPGSLLSSAPADGKRFLVGLPQQSGAPQAITIVLNWQASLKK
jgi:Tol biopolymer transport system component/predicted Ser/Thr protein kinase